MYNHDLRVSILVRIFLVFLTIKLMYYQQSFLRQKKLRLIDLWFFILQELPLYW